MFNDPIVEEVRKIRFQIEAECENDIGKIYQKAFEIQKAKNHDLISIPFEKKEFSVGSENG